MSKILSFLVVATALLMIASEATARYDRNQHPTSKRGPPGAPLPHSDRSERSTGNALPRLLSAILNQPPVKPWTRSHDSAMLNYAQPPPVDSDNTI